jgi:hypothetical protein
VTLASLVGLSSAGGAFAGSSLTVMRDSNAPMGIETVNLGLNGPTLASVSAAGPDDIWAVGYTGSPTDRTKSLTIHYDGHRWSRVASPDIGQLVGVTTISHDDAWAIAANNGRAQILYWNGTRWIVRQLPKLNNLQPTSIAASGPNNVWIVGSHAGARLPADSIGDHTLALHWTGRGGWHLVPSPNPSHRYDEYNAVVTRSPTDAWAVGNSTGRCVTSHWDGRSWRTVALPSQVRTSCQRLAGIGYGGSRDLWALGAGDGPGDGGPLYVRWTGQQWVRVRAMHGAETPAPVAVSGTTPADMWSVGCDYCSGSVIAHLRQRRWQTVAFSVPGIRRFQIRLADVATLSSTNAWSVGTAQATTPPDTSHNEAVLLHWNGNSWTPTRINGVESAGIPAPVG